MSWNCKPPRTDAAHLLTCASCRTRARVEAAWKALPRPQEQEPALATGPRFVRAVTDAIRRDRVRRIRLRYALAAAAALLFFFCAGTAHEIASMVQPNPDDSYASIVTPGELNGLIPN